MSLCTLLIISPTKTLLQAYLYFKLSAHPKDIALSMSLYHADGIMEMRIDRFNIIKRLNYECYGPDISTKSHCGYIVQYIQWFGCNPGGVHTHGKRPLKPV